MGFLFEIGTSWIGNLLGWFSYPQSNMKKKISKSIWGETRSLLQTIWFKTVVHELKKITNHRQLKRQMVKEQQMILSQIIGKFSE